MVILGAFKDCIIIKPLDQKKLVEKACGYSPLSIGHEQRNVDEVSRDET